MRVKKSFFITMAVWFVLLIVDSIVEYVNMNSASGAVDIFMSGLTGGGFQKTTLMGIKFSLNGIGISPQFFVILIIFAVIGLFLSNRNTQTK